MQTYTVTVDNTGTIIWHNTEGQRHRVDGPAVEYANGNREWWVNGRRHRLGGPAIEFANGYRAWYQHGKPHRTDGPAIEDTNVLGRKSRWWYVNGKYHRLDGPAIERANGNCEYWVNGQELTLAEFEAQQTKELTVAKVEALLGHRVKIIG